MKRINIYIDGNNLYQGAKKLNFKIDYKKFGGWLRQKYNPARIYIFIGFVLNNVKFYKHLEECGFTLIFKQTITSNGVIKGNCDAELVLKTVSDFYKNCFELCVLITGDGDFGCLVEFLKEEDSLYCVIAPDKNKCSILIKNKNIQILFLNEIYHKFSNKILP